ncbi:hypothetical protein [Nostoc sp.]|uniref:hypothetical protein n=1 Tax=Nostoc sp. TaxID=1180 RepID=UPI002D78464A|nr:hypothetical protein [Nostoc sp.]
MSRKKGAIQLQPIFPRSNKVTVRAAEFSRKPLTTPLWQNKPASNMAKPISRTILKN